jgi:hypothetical protein
MAPDGRICFNLLFFPYKIKEHHGETDWARNECGQPYFISFFVMDCADDGAHFPFHAG